MLYRFSIILLQFGNVKKVILNYLFISPLRLPIIQFHTASYGHPNSIRNPRTNTTKQHISYPAGFAIRRPENHTRIIKYQTLPKNVR